jgi:hypothetical protein
MILALDIPGNIIFLIVAAAVGVLNWWIERRKKQAEQEPQSPVRPQPRSTVRPAAGGDSEQERLRRFLEALGVPQQPGAPAPPAQSPPPPQREIVPTPAQRPVPRPTPSPAKRAFTPGPRPLTLPTQPAVRRAQRPPARPVMDEPPEFAEAGRLEEPAAIIEGISSEFEGMTMERLGVPMRLAGAAAHVESVHRPVPAIVQSLRESLRTRDDLRTAFVLMEVLGAPRGLQSQAPFLSSPSPQ